MWYLAMLVVTVIATLGLVLGLTFLRYQGESDARSRVEKFDLRSLVLATEVSNSVGGVRQVVASADVADGSFDLEMRRKLANGVFVVSEGVADLSLLQEAFGPASLAPLLRRAEEHAGELNRLLESESTIAVNWQEELAAMELSMLQLRRLHAISVESELEQIEDRSNQARVLAVVVVPLALLIGAVVVGRLTVLIRRRLAELDEANQGLSDARQLLEQSQRLDALGTLVGGVAHDFNNLLMVILLQAEIAQDEVSPEDPAHVPLQQIQTAAEQAAKTTRQLLSFSRQDAAQPEVVDLNRRIRDLEPILRGLVGADIELELDTADGLGAVFADPVQIEQVLMNLVLNARDAIPHSGQVSIRTTDVQADEGQAVPIGSYNLLQVEDTGAGMSTQVLARAFEPFFTTKTDSQGTGLGLATVHGIVTNFGGHIRVKSAIGQGTRFDLYIPRVENDSSESRLPLRVSEEGGSETILVVEDEKQIREPLSSQLRERGYQVFAAADANEALDLCRKLGVRPDLVLTDVVMPGIRGPELVAMVKENNPNVAVIYMSGYIEDTVLSAVMASGDHFMPKPVEVERVLRAVRECLDAEGSGQPVKISPANQKGA